MTAITQCIKILLGHVRSFCLRVDAITTLGIKQKLVIMTRALIIMLTYHGTTTIFSMVPRCRNCFAELAHVASLSSGLPQSIAEVMQNFDGFAPSQKMAEPCCLPNICRYAFFRFPTSLPSRLNIVRIPKTIPSFSVDGIVSSKPTAWFQDLLLQLVVAVDPPHKQQDFLREPRQVSDPKSSHPLMPSARTATRLPSLGSTSPRSKASSARSNRAPADDAASFRRHYA